MGSSVRVRDPFQPDHEDVKPELEAFLDAALGKRTGERHKVGESVRGQRGEVVTDLVCPLRRCCGISSSASPGARLKGKRRDVGGDEVTSERRHPIR